MDAVLISLLCAYNYPSIDWMNYPFTKKNYPTYHHITKKCNNGTRDINNGAILSLYSHRYLHIIEQRDLELYTVINKLLLLYNKQGYNPTPEQRHLMAMLINEFEDRHREDTNSKGKKLLREEYTKRKPF